MNEYENTDKEIWREIEGEYYSPNIFVTEQGKIGINVGGVVYVQSVEKWHQQADRIAELENQLDKCSHHEAMAHQGGYEIGRASQIKELSDEEKKQISKEYLRRHLLYVVTEEVVDDHKLHNVVVSDFDFDRTILNERL
jgi:hypothetical protein